MSMHKFNIDGAVGGAARTTAPRQRTCAQAHSTTDGGYNSTPRPISAPELYAVFSLFGDRACHAEQAPGEGSKRNKRESIFPRPTRLWPQCQGAVEAADH